MDEKYIIYIIPTTGKKMYVPEVEVDSFERDYPEAVLYSDSQLYKDEQEAKARGEYEEARRNSSIDEQLKGIEAIGDEQVELSEEQKNKDSRDQRFKDIDFFFNEIRPGTTIKRNLEDDFSKINPNAEGIGENTKTHRYFDRYNQEPKTVLRSKKTGETMAWDGNSKYDTDLYEEVKDNNAYDYTVAPMDFLDYDYEGGRSTITKAPQSGILDNNREQLIPLFNNLYNDWGFTFSGTDMNADGTEVTDSENDVIWATARNGEKIKIHVDNDDLYSNILRFGYMGDPKEDNVATRTNQKELAKLKNFMNQNMGEYKPITYEDLKKQKGNRLKGFYDEELIMGELDNVEKKANALDNLGKTISEDIEVLNADYKQLQQDAANGVYKTQEELDVKIKEIKDREAQIKSDQLALKGVYDKEVQQNFIDIKKVAAEQVEIDATKGAWWQSILNTVAESVDDLPEFLEDQVSALVEYSTKAESALTGKKASEILEERGFQDGRELILGKKDDETESEYTQRLIDNSKIYTDKLGRGFLERQLGFDNEAITNEFDQRYKETTAGGVATGITQMLTYALLTRGAGSAAPAVTATTTAGRIAQFAGGKIVQSVKNPITYMFGASASANSMDEMQGPAFKGVSTAEKLAFSNLRGGVQGILEAIGVSGAINTNPLINKLIINAIKKKGSKATYKTLEGAIKKEITNKYLRGGLRVLGGGIAEGETEIIQEIADVGLKNAFNAVKKAGVLNKENSPELFNTQATDLSVDQLLKAGKIGMLSGFVFGGYGASVQAYQENALDKLNKKNFALTEALIKSPEYNKLYRSNLRAEVQQGKITKEEALENLRAVRQMGQVYKQMPKGLTTEGKQQAFALSLEKQKLEQEVGNKDKNLYKPQLDRITEIDNELETIAFEQTKAKQLARNLQLTEDISGERKIEFGRFENQEGFEQALQEKGIDSKNVVAYDREGKSLTYGDAADGLYLDLGNGTILINEKVAEKTGAISVGTHELLHDILRDRLRNGPMTTSQLVNDFKGVLSKKEMDVVGKRVRDSYGNNPTTEEWFTAFHDAIVKGDIKYSEGLGAKLAKWLTENILKPMGFRKAGFATGRQAYNFIKDYSLQTKAVVEGRQEGLTGDIGRQVLQKSDAPVSTDVTAQPSVSQDIVAENSRLSEELQEAIETDNQQAITDIKNDLFLNNQGIINEFVNSKFKDGLGISRQDFNDAVVEEVLLRLNQTYDPSKGEYGAYIREALFGGGRFGGGRLGNILRRLGQEGDLFTKDVGDTDVEAQTAVEQEEVSEETRRKPKIKLKDRLTGDVKPVLDAINAQIKNLDIDNLNFKSLKNIALNQVQELFGITPKPGNLTKGDVRAAQQYINKNADALIALLPEGATPSGTSTGVQKVLLDNFYTKRERAKMAKTGSAAGLAIFEKKSNINPKDFKAVFGITPAGQPNLADRNTSARIKALVSQTERMLVNQQVREVLGREGREIPSAIIEGKSNQMFSITQEAFTQEEQQRLQKLSQARDIKTVARQLGLGSISINDSNRKDIQLSVETAIKEYGLSLNVFESAMPASSGAVRTQVGRDSADGRKLQKFLDNSNIKAKEGDYYYALDNGKWVKAETKGKSINPPAGVTNLLPSRGRLYYGKTDPAYIRAKEAAEAFGGKDIAKPKRVTIKEGVKITLDWLNGSTRKNGPTRQEQMDINMDVLEDVSLQLQNAVKAGMDPKIAAMLIAQGYQATNGLIKISAPFDAVSEVFEYSEVGKQSKGRVAYREEHNPPASVIGATLIDAIVNNKVQQIFPFIRQNYYQTQLSFKDDFKLDQANLDATLPEGTSILNNSAIRFAKAGINLNTLINPRTGNTVAQDLGVALPNDVKFNETAIARQNQLIEEMIMENGNAELVQEQLTTEVPIFKSQEQATKDNEQVINSSKVMPSISLSNGETVNQSKTLDKALDNARALNMPIKKIRVFDFDDTLAKSKSLVYYTKIDGTQGELTAEQFAERGAQLVKDGAVMDFSDFNIVREGERGPLFDIAKKIKEARGNEDLFVLTARAPESQQAIYDFLKAEGLEFKKENIIGLGNSTGEAKAAWLVGKAAEGYNDFYFADDAVANVDAVKLAMSQLDVKSRVQRAMPKLSVTLDNEFNNIIEQTTGISADREYSAAKAKTLGSTKGKFKFFVPYSAEDFVGLIYKTLSKGALGDQQMAWYKENLLDPFARAMQSLSQARVQLMSDFRKLKKDLKQVPKTLRKKTADGFTYEQAVRAYIWDKQGLKVPGLDAADIREFRKIVLSDPDLRAFAEQLMEINKTGSYPPPDASWLAGNIASDLINGLNTISRKQFLQQWQQNVDAIYSEKNLNKLEALYGSKYREALENILQRMKTGRNRLEGGSRLADRMLNYINGSIGAIMFFNMRSAVLQTISAINFMNWSDNNPLAAGKAFANQTQYWSDFIMLMNSDFLRDRRDGVRLNVSESEIADLAKTSKNKAKAVMAYIIEKGYLPTKFADSFAISLGGASFYRNRLNTYLKQGLTETEARERAMLDFREVAEESQQSSRPDRISQQQASSMGRLLLAFANTPMQYTRLTKKAFQDLMAGRGDRKTNISKIIYYMTAQNLIFNALQSGLFALGFGDEEEDDEKKEKMYLRTANGMADSFLRGMGIGGQAVSVTKNWLLDLYERSGRSRPDYVDSIYKLLQFSPPISSKISRLRQAAYPFDSKKRRQEMIDKGFSLDNPAYESIAKVISATTNLPADRVLLKYKNIETAMTEDLQTWQKIAMLLGWPKWQIAGDKKEQEKPKSNNKRTQKRTGGRLQSRTTRLQTR